MAVRWLKREQHEGHQPWDVLGYLFGTSVADGFPQQSGCVQHTLQRCQAGRGAGEAG